MPCSGNQRDRAGSPIASYVLMRFYAAKRPLCRGAIGWLYARAALGRRFASLRAIKLPFLDPRCQMRTYVPAICRSRRRVVCVELATRSSSVTAILHRRRVIRREREGRCGCQSSGACLSTRGEQLILNEQCKSSAPRGHSDAPLRHACRHHFFQSIRRCSSRRYGCTCLCDLFTPR